MRKFRLASKKEVEAAGWLDEILVSISLTADQIQKQTGIIFELVEDDPSDAWWATIKDQETGMVFGLRQFEGGRKGITYIMIPKSEISNDRSLPVIMELLDLAPSQIDWIYSETNPTHR